MNCKICGAENIRPSYGGADICGACDCYGFCERCKILTEQNKDLKTKLQAQAQRKPGQAIREALNRLGSPTTHYHKETENEEREQTIKDTTEILKKALTESRHLDKNKIIEILVKLPLIIPVADKNLIAEAIVKEL